MTMLLLICGGVIAFFWMVHVLLGRPNWGPREQYQRRRAPPTVSRNDGVGLVETSKEDN